MPSLFAEPPAGVDALLRVVRERVDAWRGWALGGADVAWAEPGRYEPCRDGERPLSETSLLLLRHWFRPLPHEIGGDGSRLFRYWPHQRRMVETILYLHEVCRVGGTDALYAQMAVRREWRAVDPWSKLGGQLATGAGKTKIMSLLIAWSVLNARREGADHLGLGPQVLLIAPNCFVRDRLLADFRPDPAPDGSGAPPSVFRADPVIPPLLEPDWQLSVYTHEDCPHRLDPAEPALLLTNIHRLYEFSDDASGPSEFPDPLQSRQEHLAFHTARPPKLEEQETLLTDRLRRGAGLLVINDEAHHVGDEPAHARFEEIARKKAHAGAAVPAEMAWIRTLRALHRQDRIGLQLDLSATLYEEPQGAARQQSRQPDAPPPAPFQHTVLEYSLGNAIRDGVVKQPILEHPVIKDSSDQPVPDAALINEQATDAWEKYKVLVTAGIFRWKAVRDQMEQEGRDRGHVRKPLLFILCADQKEAIQIANMLTHGEPFPDIKQDRPVTGFRPDGLDETLFVEQDGDGALRSQVIQVHIGNKEATNEEEWAKIRATVNTIDQDDNPYRVVVSVMMLKEGWDVRNVKVIVPLRACDSLTLTEQTLGRGLRRMNPPRMDEDGAVTYGTDELYVLRHPSFARVISQVSHLLTERTSQEIDTGALPEWVEITPAPDAARRQERDVQWVRFLGMQEEKTSWYERFRVDTLPAPRLPWLDEWDDRIIETTLERIGGGQSSGLRFTLAAAPAYHDYLSLLDRIYVEPLQKELLLSRDHRLNLRAVVKSCIERRIFKLPRGLPFSLDAAVDAEDGAIAVCNILRPEVIAAVRAVLLPALRQALQTSDTKSVPRLSTEDASGLDAYRARKEHVIGSISRSVFLNAAVENADEERFARLLDKCPDVCGWVYNHRSGVGWSIPFEWLGAAVRYFPDFVVRASWEGRTHNLIIEIKGRMDERDEAKARAGQRAADTLCTHHSEPWHYLLVREDPKFHRTDLSWWACQPDPTLGALFRYIEGIPASGLLHWRRLSQDAVQRDILHRAEQSGISYTALMALAEQKIADPDQLLIQAESLVHRRQLRRLLRYIPTGTLTSDARLSELLAAGDTPETRETEIVYAGPQLRAGDRQ